MKIFDGTLSYRDPNRKTCNVRIRIFENDARLVIVATEAPGHGMSLTNSVEYAMAAGCGKLAEIIEAEPGTKAGKAVVYVEHTAANHRRAETFDLVVFHEPYDPESCRFGGPAWRRLQLTEFEELLGDRWEEDTMTVARGVPPRGGVDDETKAAEATS